MQLFCPIITAWTECRWNCELLFLYRSVNSAVSQMPEYMSLITVATSWLWISLAYFWILHSLDWRGRVQYCAREWLGWLMCGCCYVCCVWLCCEVSAWSHRRLGPLRCNIHWWLTIKAVCCDWCLCISFIPMTGWRSMVCDVGVLLKMTYQWLHCLNIFILIHKCGHFGTIIMVV